MKSKLAASFIEEIFFIKKDNCLLEEKEQISYNVTVSWARGKEMIIVSPEEIKKRTNYIKRNALPKDCDYVLIDIVDKIIFYIELKNSNSSSTALEVSQQLKDGEWWIQHLFYLMGIENEYDEYQVFFIHSVLDARPAQKSRNMKPNIHNVFKMNGNKINLIPLLLNSIN